MESKVKAMSSIKKFFNPITQAILFFWDWKNVIFYTIAPFSIILILYLIFVNINPGLSFFNYVNFKNSKYHFYSGGKSGSYYLLGEYLSKNSEETNFGVKVKNEETEAGYQNVLKVLSDPMSFGIVQGDVIKNNDNIRNELNYIVPLYLERMHVLYRIPKNGKTTNLDDKLIRLSTTSSINSLTFFASAKINLGPTGGGSSILASYILTEINQQIINAKIDISKQLIFNLPIGEAFDLMKDTTKSTIDLMFYMGGAPNKHIYNLIEKGYHLAEIDLSLITKINNDYALNLKYTNLNKKYPFNNITTFGSYAYLITQKSTPEDDIIGLLNNLITIGKIDKIGAVENSDIDSLKKEILRQVDEYSFFSAFQIINSNFSLQKKINILFFIAALILSVFVTIFFYKRSLSNKYKDLFFKELNQITHFNIPDNIIPLTTKDIQNYEEKVVSDKAQIAYVLDNNSLKNNETLPKIPFIQKNQMSIINKILMGISQLFDLRNKISDACLKSYLNNNDYLFLLNRSDQIVDKLRKSLGVRLRSEINKTNMDVHIDEKLFESFYTADYLFKTDYDDLMLRLKQRSAGNLS